MAKGSGSMPMKPPSGSSMPHRSPGEMKGMGLAHSTHMEPASSSPKPPKGLPKGTQRGKGKKR